MLTKNLLKYRVHKQRIFPLFLSTSDQHVQQIATQMISVFAGAEGLSADVLEDMLAEKMANSRHEAFYDGLKKLLFDRCSEQQEDLSSIEEKRWQLLTAAQELRSEVLYDDKEQFIQTFCEQQQISRTDLLKTLYGDLPQFLPLGPFKTITTQELIHRYNCALVQGLLLHAEHVQIVVKDSDTKTKRALFRTIKFSQLIIDQVEQEQDRLAFTVNGPLSIFENATAYGMRVANFFPYVLQMPSWELTATLNIKNRTVQLLLNSQEHPIRSHYQEISAYIPIEFQGFMENYNQKDLAWEAKSAGEFINMGRQMYCCPDLMFQHRQNGQEAQLELFHKWHEHTLTQRLDALTARPYPQLIIGVSQHLAKKTEISTRMEKLPRKNVLIFRDFPTISGVEKCLQAMLESE